MQTRSTITRLLAVAVFLGCLVLVPGCPGAGEVSNNVMGKVLLDGKPVGGSVFFMGPDNKEIGGAIGPDGIYNIAAPKKGLNKIAVRGSGLTGGLPPTGGDKIKSLDKDTTVAAPKDKPAEMGSTLAPPAKYNDYATSGLTFEVKGVGKEEHHITLEKK